MMTAADHLAYAKQLLADDVISAHQPSQRPTPTDVMLAQAHLLAAVAIELGVPMPGSAPESEATG